jgi:hypothetical protein
LGGGSIGGGAGAGVGVVLLSILLAGVM